MRRSGEGRVGIAGGLGALEGHEALALAGDDEFGVVDQGHPVLGGEALGAGADEVDVRRPVEDQTSCLDGVAQALDAGHAAGAEIGAVHQQGVELNPAVAGEKGAAAGVEGVVVFHDGDGGLDGLDSGTAAGEHGPADVEGMGDAALMGGYGGLGNRPGTAMNEQNGVWDGRRYRLGAHGLESSSLRRWVSL